MTERIGNVVLICAERPQQCDFCGQIAELRPYGPHGECICHECGMKNKLETRIQMGMRLFGETREEAERCARRQSENDH